MFLYLTGKLIIKSKKDDSDSCLIPEQSKGGFDELPDSSRFIYNLETKTAKKSLKNVWKNPQARQEVPAALTRMLIRPGKNGKPDEIVAIFLRRDLDDMAKKLKKKFD